MSDRSTARAFARKLTRGWLAAVDRAESYVPVRDRAEVPPQALACSGSWCASIFPSCADPHEPALSARIGVHVATPDTPDLLEHDYVVNGISVALIESRNFAFLRVARESADVLARAPGERAEEIRRIAAAIRGGADHPCVGTFVLPKAIEEGAMFSTNPSANPLLLTTWRDRIDGGIRHGCLYFLYFKRVSQVVGFWNDREWFDEERRAQLQSRQAQST